MVLSSADDDMVGGHVHPLSEAFLDDHQGALGSSHALAVALFDQNAAEVGLLENKVAGRLPLAVVL